MSDQEKGPKIIWDFGTGYDLFASLYVIHKAGDFGLRPSWAAGVRSRLPADVREMFSQVLDYFGLPLHWVYAMPEPKDAATVLREIEEMPDQSILPSLSLEPGYEDSINNIFSRIMEKRSWSDQDLAEIADFYGHFGSSNRKELKGWLDWWTHPEDFGERFRRGLQEYYESFFREEERRIRPILEASLNRAKKMAEKMPAAELLEQLTEGYGYKKEQMLQHEGLILVPSFWASPLVFYGKLNEKQGIIQFGARPKNTSLVPGQPVPDSLLLPLQALSDNTRLRMLRLMTENPLTQTEIAKKLRLRAPTITHHLKILRFSGLIVPVHLEKGEKRYGVRMKSIEDLWRQLREFLKRQEISDR